MTAPLDPHADVLVRSDAGARYLSARCGLNGCHADLHIEHTASRPVFLGDTAADLANPADAYSSSWSVVCEAGHTILVPIDDAGDTQTFGVCSWAADAEHADDAAHVEAWCSQNDLARLRAVIAPAVAP